MGYGELSKSLFKLPKIIGDVFRKTTNVNDHKVLSTFIFILFLLIISLIGARLTTKDTVSNINESGHSKPIDALQVPSTGQANVNAANTQQSSNSDLNSSTNSGQTDVNENNNNKNSISVNVNGHNIAVPQNGSSSQTIVSPSGQTNVNISSSQSTEGSATENNSSTTINVSSSSNDLNENGGD